MKRFIPYIAFACLTGFTAKVPCQLCQVVAVVILKAEIKCAEDDTECQMKKLKSLN